MDRRAVAIDAARATNYNKHMTDNGTDVRVDDFLCMEHAEPKKKILAGDGALYVVLLIAVIGVILLGNAVSQRWDLPRLPVQLVLYAILIVLGWLVYRYRLLAFRYVLTSRILSVDRVVGRKIKAETAVRLSDIESIRPCGEAVEGRRQALYTGRRRDALAVGVCEHGKRRTLYISPSEEFAGKLIKQWKSSLK